MFQSSQVNKQAFRKCFPTSLFIIAYSLLNLFSVELTNEQTKNQKQQTMN